VRELITAEQARAAVLSGRTVRIVRGPDPEDPTCLHYLDRCYENDFEPMIYSESISGWSQGIKNAICAPESAFYVEFITRPNPPSLTVVDDEPPQREARCAVVHSSVKND
jgi:hypothetical protein